jgi:hypothetical protein
LSVPTWRRPERQHGLRTLVVAIAPARSEPVVKGLSGSLEPAFLALQAVENLSLSAP